MKSYSFVFIGVKNGSIGERRKFKVTTEGNNFEEAKLRLYDTHEHIQILSVNGVKPDKDYNFDIE